MAKPNVAAIIYTNRLSSVAEFFPYFSSIIIERIKLITTKGKMTFQTFCIILDLKLIEYKKLPTLIAI